MPEESRLPGRALISVSDKSGVVDFARQLAELGVDLLSTGGTHRALIEGGVQPGEVSDYTGFPEMMDGRVKTLHPKVHGGILGRRGTDDEVMTAHGIEPIDLVVVNLYPFAQTIARDGVTRADAIEQIDIGGPAMVRSAAKNHAWVTVVVDPDDYSRVVDAIRGGGIDAELRAELAAKAFRHTAHYDATIAGYLATDDAFPNELTLGFTKIEDIRYGENPHQRAAFYREHGAASGSIASARLHQGKQLSYNNVADADGALECVKVFTEPTCVIVKHANPCGVATAETLEEAYDLAYACDTASAFGGVIAFNRALDARTLNAILDRQFVEVVIAPEVSDAAVAAAARKKNVRLVSVGPLTTGLRSYEVKRVGGGLLLQTADETMLRDGELRTVTKRAPTETEMADLLFAWRVAWFVKSNAIVYAQGGRTLGIGAGQMSRVDSARIGVAKARDAGLAIDGAAMASEAFFPFRDSIDTAAQNGVRAVIQPGGSMRDEEVIAAADEHDMAMVFTGLRHFRH